MVEDYVEAIVRRDVRDVAQIEKIAQMPRLLRILAEHSGQLVNYSGIGAATGMNHGTTQKYVGIFESLFLARAASVTNSDFSGLRILAEATKEWFVSGIALYDQDEAILFGERLSAVKISALWR